ncbi:phosphonate utilization transcriptional regulator PhnR [Vibrio hannami]|uniref:phosphonate utilization transcriptional regulator PhnR n=1 Tax=Vibrio hannami TaxID=2717094 RepID=UPI00240EBA36|nr:phosphonate utilization transcriptional regulator PhnR [Vibrio hannami]MDG3085886.1 phosphonate utilization transcriptional regulator PhnR [Vibrio hannami]
MQYVKIKDAITEQIESGLLSPHQKLPAERKLAEMFDTTRVTLREALSVLEIEGKIFREDRRGWFISPEPLKYDPTRILNFNSLALAQERRPKTKSVVAKSILATKEAASLLGLPPFTDVYCVERVRYLEERPVVYVRSYIKQTPFPGLLKFDFDASLTDIFREHFGVTYHRTHYKVSMTSLLGDIAQALHATSGTPALLVEKLNYNQDGALIDCALEYWRHDAVCIESIAEMF